MNADQKKRIAHEISNWNNASKTADPASLFLTGDRMAALLQELINAQEEITTAHLIGLPPVGELQIDAAPPAPSVPEWVAASRYFRSLRTAPPAPSVPDELSGRFTDPVKLAYADGWNSCREEMLAATHAAPPAPSVPDGWHYCPECGSTEIRYQKDRYKQCEHCGQEWFSDIDYSDVVQKHLRQYRELLAAAPPAPSVPDGLHLLISGAVYDFAGFLTTREKTIQVGARVGADIVVDLLKEWAALRGLRLDDAAVLSWQEWLSPTPAEPPADVARDAELLRKLRHSIRQAMIPGNDWRRELALMNGAIDAAIERQGGE